MAVIQTILGVVTRWAQRELGGDVLRFRGSGVGALVCMALVLCAGCRGGVPTDLLDSPPATVPDKPSSYTVTAGDARVMLAAEVSSDGGAAIIHWQYRYKTTTGGSYGSWTNIASSAAKSISGTQVTGLTNGTSYTFQVRAVNGIGESPESDEVPATPFTEQHCAESDFLENPLYTGTNGRLGPPFPFVRHVFCLSNGDNTATYSFEMSDAGKEVHATFAFEFSNFAKTDEGATATYQRATIEVKTDFAVGNALSKWVTCRDAIRSRTKFGIDDCLEIHEVSIVRIGPGEPGAPDQDRFPCGINVGPDRVRDHEGDEVPMDVYPGVRKRLTGMRTQGDRTNLYTDTRIEAVYVPESFFSTLGAYSTTLSACGR